MPNWYPKNDRAMPPPNETWGLSTSTDPQGKILFDPMIVNSPIMFGSPIGFGFVNDNDYATYNAKFGINYIFYSRGLVRFEWTNLDTDPDDSVAPLVAIGKQGRGIPSQGQTLDEKRFDLRGHGWSRFDYIHASNIYANTADAELLNISQELAVTVNKVQVLHADGDGVEIRPNLEVRGTLTIKSNNPTPNAPDAGGDLYFGDSDKPFEPNKPGPAGPAGPAGLRGRAGDNGLIGLAALTMGGSPDPAFPIAPVFPPPEPPKESGSKPRFVASDGFIGQSESGGFSGPGKYIVVGQAPPVGRFGGRYGVTIRNGQHFSSLRVIKSGDSILSWGNQLLRFRYEGSWWSTFKQKEIIRSRDIVTLDRRGHVVVFGAITSNSYFYRSDVRLKEDIAPLEGALGKVLAMRGVSYVLKEHEGTASELEEDFDKEQSKGLFMQPPLNEVQEKSVKRRRIGLIAQEVEEVCPEVVTTGEDGYKAMDATQMNAVLVEAIKGQQKIIEAQQARLDRLERALAKLGIEA